MDGFVDEFKLYNRALTTDEIQADAAFALGGVEPSFVELGCMGTGCDLQVGVALTLSTLVIVFFGYLAAATLLPAPGSLKAVGGVESLDSSLPSLPSPLSQHALKHALQPSAVVGSAFGETSRPDGQRCRRTPPTTTRASVDATL